MSYRYSWSKTFKADDFVVFEDGAKRPEKCPTHTPYCIRACSDPILITKGTLRLVDPLNIPSLMPGTKQKLLNLSVQSMLTDFGGWYSAVAWIKIIADQATLLQRDIYHYGNEWRDNLWELNIDISKVSVLDIYLREDVTLFLPFSGAILHCANITLSAEHYADIPPPTAAVRVTVKNKTTGTLVKHAYVALMSGAIVVADGYTDSGEVSFVNIEVGSYTIKVLAGGYYDFSQSIEVEAPSVWYDVKLVPIPVPPTPTWVWWAVGGLGALGAVTVIPAVIRRKPEEKVIIVR